ncbi:MAG: hypothetical protein JNL65_10405 [Saprospiraceae bacterium]|nr:hypothetical protein [Saprospiraceae bacterium]HRG68547.1 hypothetical protein [Saprospiraceae bacterium]
MQFTDIKSAQKIKGISMVAPPVVFPVDPIPSIKNTGADWIAFIPYAFSSKNKPEVIFQDLDWQWWGEREEGIRESIRLAKLQHLKVMLKPQVYIHNSWVGHMDFQSESDWKIWESQYRAYLIKFARLASDLNVDMICIATEYQIAAIKRETFFRKLIQEIKSFYKGKLCYSANWDHYSAIPFWDALDFIGISAYFPLTEQKTPTVMDLNEAWKVYIQNMERFSKKLGKQILFTEFGYLSVDGCGGKAWEIEKNIESCTVNQLAQANCYEALFKNLWIKDWWAGGFIWKWFPNGQGHEGYPEKDYTPQNKQAENILKTWYSK